MVALAIHRPLQRLTAEMVGLSLALKRSGLRPIQCSIALMLGRLTPRSLKCLVALALGRPLQGLTAVMLCLSLALRLSGLRPIQCSIALMLGRFTPRSDARSLRHLAAMTLGLSALRRSATQTFGLCQ